MYFENTIQWNPNQTFFIEKNNLKMSSAKEPPFGPGPHLSYILNADSVFQLE